MSPCSLSTRRQVQHHVKEGRILMSIHSDDSDSTKRAKATLVAAGAQHVSSTGESKASAVEAR